VALTATENIVETGCPKLGRAATTSQPRRSATLENKTLLRSTPLLKRAQEIAIDAIDPLPGFCGYLQTLTLAGASSKPLPIVVS
jgi:hypothetical protein